jgi:hypothetical protein
MSDEGKPSSGESEVAPSREGEVTPDLPSAEASGGLAYEQARLAYTIIQSLLEHTRVTQDLVALMAQVLSEDTQDALVNTPHWAAYMDSRRALERTRADVEKFAEVWTKLAEELEPTPARSNPETDEEG